MKNYNSPADNTDLISFITWSADKRDPFYNAILEHLARYPVCIKDFIENERYLGLKTVYPGITSALEEIFHPTVLGLDHPIRMGTTYREVILTGSIGAGKTYAAVLGILYSVYLLSCFRDPHALFGLDSASEIVFLFQSIRHQTGSVAFRLARELIDGSNFFTKHFPKDKQVKNEILLPHNIVLRPVSGDQTATLGMNIVTVLLDEMSYMKYHSKSVKAEDGGEFNQAEALYNTARARVDSRFSKYGKHLVPIFLAGSARHKDDFIQGKIAEYHEQISLHGNSDIYVYNKKIWEVKPWNYSGDTFRVFLGSGCIQPQIVLPDSDLYNANNTIDIPIELKPAFTSNNFYQALRDHAGVPTLATGNFIVNHEAAINTFKLDNIFENETCTFTGNDLPILRESFLSNPNTNVVWCAHLDLSRTDDSTGIAFGYIDKWGTNYRHFTIAGVIEVQPTKNNVIPWDRIRDYLYYLASVMPLYVLSADQVGYSYIREHFDPYGFKHLRISDNASSDIFHTFLSDFVEGKISIANHTLAKQELLALNVDYKTNKVTKPAGGSKDCIDAVVSLVCLMRKLGPLFSNPLNLNAPTPP